VTEAAPDPSADDDRELRTLALRILLLLDAGYALAVAAAAMVWPPAALGVAAAFLVVQAIVLMRRPL
jgi:hypothetical protein